MSIKNSLGKWILKGYNFIGKENGKAFFPDMYEARHDFASIIFSNITGLLTDLTNDTTLVYKSGDIMLFSEFKSFFDFDGQTVLERLYNKGFAVISHDSTGFTLLDSDQYANDGKNRAIPTDAKFKNSRIYVLKSDSYRAKGKSDRELLTGFLTYLDNVMNASNTATARLGTAVMACPVTPAGSNAVSRLVDDAKERVEKDISENYGLLKHQKQIHIWEQQMAFTTINFASMDAKTIDKVKFAVTIICDRIKVPANQSAIIDTANTNSLSNGGEMREGDIMKYKSYERLLNKTFIRMATDLDLTIDYSIYNKPQMQIQQQQTTVL